MSLRAALSFQGLMTLSRRSIKLPPRGSFLLLCGVIPQLAAFGLCEDAEKCRIAVRDPMAEGKAANEDGDTGENGIEEVEGAHSADAFEVEQRPFRPK